MNIDNWPMDRIMRLPDWCFGRRWFVGTYCGEAGGGVAYFTCQESLPDKFVVWGVLFCARNPAPVNVMRVTIRLGDHTPVSGADAMTMERLFKGISTPGILYEFYSSQWDLSWNVIERILIETAGRRIQVVTNGDQANAYEMTVAVLISALPKEVPDWLSSGQDRNL